MQCVYCDRVLKADEQTKPVCIVTRNEDSYSVNCIGTEYVTSFVPNTVRIARLNATMEALEPCNFTGCPVAISLALSYRKYLEHRKEYCG